MITKEDYKKFLLTVYAPTQHHYVYQFLSESFDGGKLGLEIVRHFDNINDINRLFNIIENYDKIVNLSFLKSNFDEAICEIFLSQNSVFRLQELQIELLTDHRSLISSLKMKGCITILMPILFVLELFFTGDIERVKPSTDNLMNFETMFNNG